MKIKLLFLLLFVFFQTQGQTPNDSCDNGPILQVDTEYSINNLNTNQYGAGVPIQGHSPNGGNVKGFWFKVQIPNGFYAENIEVYDVSNNFNPVIGLKSNCDFDYYPNINSGTDYADENGYGEDETFGTGLTGPSTGNNGIYHIRIYHYNNDETPPTVDFKIRITDNSTSSEADLSVHSLSINPTTAIVGEDVDLVTEIINLGELDVTETVNIFYTIDGVEIDDDTVSGSDLPLSQGETDEEQESNYVFTSAGTYEYCVTIENHPQESNYSNNTMCINIVVEDSNCTGISITQQPNNQSVSSGNSATFSVSATGTTPITYQWKKNGATISGATSSTYTTPTLNTSDNGNTYQCELTNCDGTVSSNIATLTVSNTTNGSIIGSLSVPYIDDNFQIQSGSTDGFVIKIYENGNSKPLMQTSLDNNDNFSFTNLPQDSYHIIAEKIVNGTIVSSVQESFVSTGSSITLKSSYDLINQIDNYNSILSDLTCTVDITNSTYNLLNSLNHSYYTEDSESYLNNTSNSIIVDNDDFVIDKLSRIMIVNKATKQYFDNAKALTNEYMTTVYDATEIFYQFLSYLRCRNLIVSSSIFIPNILVDIFQEIYVYVLSSITLNSENIFHSSTIESSFDLIYSFVTGQNEFNIIEYADVITLIGLDQIWINNFINKGYVYQTYDAFFDSINSVINNNQSLTLSELGDYMDDRLYEANSLVISTNINVTSYRNLPNWINMTFTLSDILATNTCNSNLLLFGTLTNVLEATLLYDSMLHSYIGKADLKNRANANISYSSNRFQNTNNDPDYILPLIQSIENKLNLYNTKLQNSISAINDNTFSDTMFDELNSLISEITEIQNILSISFITLKPNSSYSENIFNEKLNQSMFNSPASRLAFSILFKEYLNQQETNITSDLNNNYQELINRNQLTITNLYDLKNSLNSTDLEVRLGIINNNIPSIININETNDYALDIFNYGNTVANNVILEIQSANSNATFSQTVFNLGNINPFTKSTVNIPIQTNSDIGETFYTLRINSNSSSDIEIDRILTTLDASTLNVNQYYKQDEFNIYPNPNNGQFTIRLDSLPNEKIKIIVYNSIGQKISTFENEFTDNDSTKSISLKNLNSGIYYVKVFFGTNSKTGKVVIK